MKPSVSIAIGIGITFVNLYALSTLIGNQDVYKNINIKKGTLCQCI